MCIKPLYSYIDQGWRDILMIDGVDEWNELGVNEKVVIVMDRVC